MESDRRYFLEGLFIIVLSIAVALAFVWLARSGHRDDVVYRIHFGESVSGLAIGDPVKFRGVDVGNVKSIAVEADDPRLVRVDVSVRKDAPIKTDTKASLRLKGITGVVFVELNGGTPKAMNLVDATPVGQTPEIGYERNNLTAFLDELPKVVEKFSSLEDQARKAVTDVRGLTGEIKENPSLLLKGRKAKDAPTR